VKVGSVVIDCNDFESMFSFWRDALRYVPRDTPDEDFVVLNDAEGSNVNVSISKVPEPRVGKNRLHLDLYTDDQEGEVKRLLELGAKLHPRVPKEGEDFIVLEDPEGNLFCVVDTTLPAREERATTSD
jgi:Glyoxalase-like domain